MRNAATTFVQRERLIRTTSISGSNAAKDAVPPQLSGAQEIAMHAPCGQHITWAAWADLRSLTIRLFGRAMAAPRSMPALPFLPLHRRRCRPLQSAAPAVVLQRDERGLITDCPAYVASAIGERDPGRIGVAEVACADQVSEVNPKQALGPMNASLPLPGLQLAPATDRPLSFASTDMTWLVLPTINAHPVRSGDAAMTMSATRRCLTSSSSLPDAARRCAVAPFIIGRS